MIFENVKSNFPFVFNSNYALKHWGSHSDLVAATGGTTFNGLLGGSSLRTKYGRNGRTFSLCRVHRDTLQEMGNQNKPAPALRAG